jgi:hypothetical protein
VGICTGEYNDAEDSDNRAWAAAELYRTTGKAEYRNAFESWWSLGFQGFGWSEFAHFQREAMWAYLRANWPDADEAVKAGIKKAFIDNGETLLQNTEANGYLNGARLDVPDWIGWGTFNNSTIYSFHLLLAYALSGEEKFFDNAAINLDTQLGANPLSISFVTGLGTRYPRDPLQGQSIFDGVAEPIPGIPVFGTSGGMP